MAEELMLTTPQTTPAASTTSLRVAQLLLNPESGRFLLAVRGTRGELIEVARQGPDAVALMRALNKSNNTLKSMERRALEWFLAQPEGAPFAGTITGAPD